MTENPPAYLDISGTPWVLQPNGTYRKFVPSDAPATTSHEIAKGLGPRDAIWFDGNSPLPNLSRWHEVPTGATIPKGTQYAVIAAATHIYTAKTDVHLGRSCQRHFTEGPLEDPDADLIKRICWASHVDEARAVIAKIREEKN